jgi:hypothetical protein
MEIAVTITLIFAMTFWVFELSMYAYTCAVLHDAAHEGIRYAIAHGSDSSVCSGPTTGCTDTSGTYISDVVKGISKNTFHNVTGMTVTPAWPESTGCKPGSLVTVSVSYPYVSFFHLGFSQTARASAQGRIVF